MALESKSETELRAPSVAARLRESWTAISQTVPGDIIATAIAIAGMAAIFLACAIAIAWLMRAGTAALRLVGAG